MQQNLDNIKLRMLSPKCQVTLFDVQGNVLQSCDTLLKTEPERSIFYQFDFLLSIQEVLVNLEKETPLEFDLIEWQEQREGLFGMNFQKIDAATIQWFIWDRSDEKDQILSVQQARNNSAINEELLEIRQKYLESEKKLLSFQNDELKRVQKFKERFFAEVSHEMRTPLNSITGLVKLLEWSDPNAIYDYLHALKATSEHLNHIINDVLDLSKVEEGKLKLEYLSFNLHEITQAILKGFSLLAEEKKIYLKSEIDPSIPKYIVADPIRLSQILYNIIGNAIKFTHQGGITLAINLEKQLGDAYLIKFAVKDTGIGMAPENIQKILEPYAQVEGQSYFEYGGTGLGMGIAQRLIAVMGGDLEIESEPGKGTQMFFEISCEQADHSTYSIDDHYDPSANVDTSNFVFLFAEDDAMNTMIMRERSAKWNLNSHFVSNIDELKNELWNNTFDILITDINLGDDNAIDLLIELRASQAENKNIPIIFTSGDNQELYPELEKLDQWAYLIKPVNPKSLSLKIREMLKLCADNSLESVDLSNLKAAAQHNIEFVVELIDTILEHLPLDMEKLSEAVKANELETARKLLHKMNPSIGYLGIESLSKERHHLHDKVSQGQTIESELTTFKTRINMALEDLAAQKLELKA